MNLFNNTKREEKDMEMFISQQEARMEKVAKNIERWLVKHELTDNVHIYFNNVRWSYKVIKPLNFEGESKVEKTITEDIKGSDYFDYANDDTISMAFDGGSFYSAINNHYGFALSDAFDTEVDFDGMYYELGHSWNLSFVD